MKHIIIIISFFIQHLDSPPPHLISKSYPQLVNTQLKQK